VCHLCNMFFYKKDDYENHMAKKHRE
jgi:uncharacterized C2H2 Zn-finger protein